MVLAKEVGKHSVLNDNTLKSEHIEALWLSVVLPDSGHL